MLLNWTVYLHIAGVFGLMLAHGASAAVSFALARERNLERVKALLELSSGSIGVMYISLLVVLITGIAAGGMVHAWGRGWIWTALILLVVIFGAMGAMGSRIFGEARKAIGLPYRGQKTGGTPASPEEIDRVLSQGKPMLLTVIGFGGILIILWLMRFKPF